MSFEWIAQQGDPTMSHNHQSTRQQHVGSARHGHGKMSQIALGAAAAKAIEAVAARVTIMAVKRMFNLMVVVVVTMRKRG
jgi:hypothetical protein